MATTRKTMILSFITLLLLMGAAGALSLNQQPNKTQVIPAPVAKAHPPTVSELLKLVNAERAKNGIAPLALNELLTKSAQWKADREVASKYSGHTNPEAGENSGLDYLETLHPPCVYIGENLYWGYDARNPDTSEGAVAWWISSPTHREAILNKEYTLTGFGISGQEVVQHFCQQS